MRVARCTHCKLRTATWGEPAICVASACRAWGDYYEEHLRSHEAEKPYLVRDRDDAGRFARDVA